MKRFRIISLIIISIVHLSLPAINSSEFNCFSILVGKEATEDGSILFAHNEDDEGEYLVDWYKVPPLTHSKDEKIILKQGEKVPQVKNTFGYIWLQMLGMDFSDSYMNEWGITASSNECQSKEENGELVNGGIGYFLRRIMVERARTAREAVKIEGNLIENFGYTSSGRSYCIAGPNEVWVLAAVKGKHWIAQRVPNHHVAIVPNYYTIERVNLKDTLNFLGSSDIMKYAVEKGWYQPETKKEFNFRIAYAKPSKLYSMINIARHWRALNLLSEKEYNINQKLSFSFNPKGKISLQDLMFVLQDHYEGTQLEMNPAYNAGNPHENVILRICSENNKYGFIAQIRNWLPKEIRTILWIAPRRPCINPFIPWYCGITEVPERYTLGDFREALRNHFDPPHEIRKQTSSHAFWVFVSYADKIDENYGNLIKKVKDTKNHFQKTIFNKQRLFEDTVLSIYKKDKQKARKKLTEFTAKMTKEAINLIKWD